MAFTQADIDGMRRLIASGANTIRHSDGRTVTYDTLDEKLKALALMEGELAQSTSGRTTFAEFDRG